MKRACIWALATVATLIGGILVSSLIAAPAFPGAVWVLAQSVPAQVAEQKAAAVHSYEGTRSCKKCHTATEKSWQETPHAKAMETLKPGNDKEAKLKFNLDPEKDYTLDPKCVKCHVVGMDKPGGYKMPDPADEKSVKAAAKMENVGCECCHGPGEAYTKLFEEISKSGRKYKVEELYAAGMQKVDENTCKGCHNPESPVLPDGEFDFEKMKEKGVHAHEPLKQREG